MHHPHSYSLIWRYRISAFLFFGTYLLVTSSIMVLGYSLLTDNQRLSMIGIGLMILSITLVIVQWIAACGTGCPLCRTPVLAPRTCTKHLRARTLMGSHRLRVSLAILLKGQFRCPYCNESSQLKLREKPPSNDQKLQPW